MAIEEGVSSAVGAAAAYPDAATADFLPLDDSSESNGHESINDDQDEGGGDDFASDVSMIAETDEEGDSHVPTPMAEDAIATSQGSTSKKRKSPDVTSDTMALEPAKKVKSDQVTTGKQNTGGHEQPSSNRSVLPAEVWHHIFTFSPPRTLGRLLLVSRLFNVYLDPSSSIHCERPAPLSTSALSILKPNALWQASRRLFWPNMPTPLQGKTELDMWRLSCSTTCEHCGKQATLDQQDLADTRRPGTGKDSVVTVWPFATRSCGPCLLNKSIKVGSLVTETFALLLTWL